MYREIEISAQENSSYVISTEYPPLSSRPNGVSGEISPCATLSRDDKGEGKLSRDDKDIEN